MIAFVNKLSEKNEHLQTKSNLDSLILISKKKKRKIYKQV